MKKLVLLILTLSIFTCAQEKKQLKGETEWQREMNAFFKDASRSPLKSKDLKTFDGLDFFKFDSTFIVKAKIDLTPEAKPIKMKTTTSRLAKYRQYGIVKFELDGKLHELSIYQDMDLLGTPEYESFLFLPFLDNTNGNSSYSGGRYVETTANEGEAITIDFNKSYNPYCAYNENYSCPIVPRSNYINAEIKAGVKNYKKP